MREDWLEIVAHAAHSTSQLHLSKRLWGLLLQYWIRSCANGVLSVEGYCDAWIQPTQNKFAGRKVPQEIHKRCWDSVSPFFLLYKQLVYATLWGCSTGLFFLHLCLLVDSSFVKIPCRFSRVSGRSNATGQCSEGRFFENQPSRFCFATPFNSTWNSKTCKHKKSSSGTALAGQSTGITARAKCEFYTGSFAENLAKSKHSTETLGFTVLRLLRPFGSWKCAKRQFAWAEVCVVQGLGYCQTAQAARLGRFEVRKTLRERCAVELLPTLRKCWSLVLDRCGDWRESIET